MVICEAAFACGKQARRERPSTGEVESTLLPPYGQPVRSRPPSCRRYAPVPHGLINDELLCQPSMDVTDYLLIVLYKDALH